MYICNCNGLKKCDLEGKKLKDVFVDYKIQCGKCIREIKLICGKRNASKLSGRK